MLAAVNSAISVLMADIEGSLSGFLLSSSLIVVFGEILPQALVNRWPVIIGYYSRNIMYFYFAVTFVFSYPVGVVLNRIFGEDEGNLLSKSRMKKLFEKYEQQNVLQASERKILSAALELKNKTVGSAMTPLSNAFMLDIN